MPQNGHAPEDGHAPAPGTTGERPEDGVPGQVHPASSNGSSAQVPVDHEPDGAAAGAGGRNAEHAPRTAAELVEEIRLGSAHAMEPEQRFGQPGRPIRRGSPFYLGFIGALGVLVAYTLVQAVVNARSVLILIIVSFFLAAGLDPAVRGLVRRGLRRSLAIGVVFIAVIAVFVGFGFAVVPPLVAQTNEFLLSVPGYVDDLQRSARMQRLDEQYGILANIESYVRTADLGERVFGGIVGFGRIVLDAVFSAFTVLILTLYFLAALPHIKAQGYRLVPASRRPRVTLLADEVLRRIGGYISGAVTVATLGGVSAYVFFTVIELPYALPLALFAGLMSIVPMVGATIAGIVVAAVAFFQSIRTGIAVVVFYTIYQQVENYVIYPRIMKRSVDVPAAVTVVAALLGGALLGVVGALLAIPIAAGLLLILREVVVPRQDTL